MNVLVFGAHPDDPDISAGGVSYLYGQLGHRVKFVSMTDGSSGHHEIGGVELAKRRYEEAQNVAKVLGLAEYQLLDIRDGELEPTLANRKTVIRIIREFKPDLIMTPRPNDYHPDHRYTSQLVQDAAYMVTVPNIVPLAEHLRVNPVIVYTADNFTKPYPFTPSVVVDVGDAMQAKIDALHCHTSQMYEWLPYNARRENEVPTGEDERKKWTAERYLQRFTDRADKYRELLVRFYGPARAAKVRYAEAFEGGEYGSHLTDDLIPTLFPFFG
jgi:N-acetylglucosamine malate deacetylase 1